MGEFGHEHQICLDSSPSLSNNGGRDCRIGPKHRPLRAFIVDLFWREVEFWLVYYTSDELTMYGMHHSLKPVMCAEFVVDVVEMVAKCLQTDTKRSRDFARILAL
jgi:hypothetical protein